MGGKTKTYLLKDIDPDLWLNLKQIVYKRQITIGEGLIEAISLYITFMEEKESDQQKE